MKITINNATIDTDLLSDEEKDAIRNALDAPVVSKPFSKLNPPKEGERYEYLSEGGFSSNIWQNDIIDAARLKRGNVLRIGEGKYRDRLRIAKQAIWDYVEANGMGVRLYWSDEDQQKAFAVYDRGSRKWELDAIYRYQYQFELPHVHTSEFDRYLADNAEHFAVIAEGVEKWGK